jgi:hypothetical protein
MKEDFGYLLLLCVALFLGMCICYISFTPPSGVPTALDVYRGKTTLKVIFRDSAAIDSIVVFKDNR